jgi:hypothetical protein
MYMSVVGGGSPTRCSSTAPWLVLHLRHPGRLPGSAVAVWVVPVVVQFKSHLQRNFTAPGRLGPSAGVIGCGPVPPLQAICAGCWWLAAAVRPCRAH